ncbi:MAG: hypothetical protein GXP54_05370 [Deltaproteobacteria bacterium]|nr:hypothetical protein [Deltaproteobacteria bacterium]
MKRAVALLLILSLVAMGCYSTYQIPRTELQKLQSSETGTAVVKGVDGEDLVVEQDTRLFVRSKGGKRYPITPFNFKMTESQLVASDRDYILDMNGLEQDGEVDNLSIWKTALLGTLGGLVLSGIIVWAVLEGRSSGSSQGN